MEPEILTQPPAVEPEPEPVAIEPTPEPVAAEPPAWDWPTVTPEPAPAVEPAYNPYDPESIQQGAVDSVTGLMRNQSQLRSALTAQGASEEVKQLAEYTLLSMDPNMMGQPGAAQIAASLAIGSMAMQNKSWKSAPIANPPTAQPVGRANPSHTSPELETDKSDFNKAFEGMGITADLLEEN